MDLIIADPHRWDSDVNESPAVSGAFQAAGQLFPSIHRRSGDIGMGASLPVEVLVLGGLFFLGEQIQKNLDAWLNLARRFTKFLSQLELGRRVDPTGADLVLLNELQERFDHVEQLEKLFESEIIAWEVTHSPEGTFERTPERLYIRCFKVNDSTIVVAGLTSHGSISFWHQYVDVFRMVLGEEE